MAKNMSQEKADVAAYCLDRTVHVFYGYHTHIWVRDNRTGGWDWYPPDLEEAGASDADSTSRLLARSAWLWINTEFSSMTLQEFLNKLLCDTKVNT